MLWAVPQGYENTPLTRQNLAKYYAEVTYLDSLVGRTLNIIESTGNKNNTLVIFTSEQGSQFPFDKWTCYDRGLKTAFIARWPGVIQAGVRSQAMIQYVDVAPTLVEIGGGNPATINTGTTDANGKTGFDGLSFADVLKGTKSTLRDYVFGVQTTRGIINGSDAYAIRSVRNKQFLYINNLNYTALFSCALIKGQMFQSWLERYPTGRGVFYQQRPEEELYNVVNDPDQLVNLAGDAQYASIKTTLKNQLTAWMKQQGDKGKETELAADSRMLSGDDD
ncbi:sulfatase/phosphatase domain-containing protein [Pedobacter sp. BS3]|uniref:sulfatase/phosphatase domain-containing protein n=1 Tax=Pedobacter sp. BS3 TaxID=2567937 RepID=UPI001659CBFF|nr:sulfatase/phosphatase domain-containing protein [Pedobacter sp. BS3]